MITEVKYLPKEEGESGNAIHVKYDNGNIAVFNYVEGEALYEEIKAWAAVDGNTIAEAD